MNIVSDFEYVSRVIESCVTLEQLENANNLIKAFNHRWYHEYNKGRRFCLAASDNLKKLILYRNKLDRIWWDKKTSIK